MLKVAIFDDEEHIRDFLKKYIPWRNLSMEIICESDDGITALELYKKLKPDIVLTDIKMPGMDGMSLLEEIKIENRLCEVILISGYADFSYAQKALRCGAFDYIIKPIDETELEKLLVKVKEKFDKEKKAKEQNEQIKTQLIKLQNELEDTDSKTGCVFVEKNGNPVIQKAVEYINGQYNREITLQDVADKVFMNIKYFSALFRKETGVKFTEYITQVRLEKAKKLLQVRHLKVTEVANMVGFRDDSYFVNVFRKYTGMAPSEYRQKLT